MFENLSFFPKRGPEWPVELDGSPEPPALLTHVSTYDMNGDIVVGMLRSFGIPVTTSHPNNGDFDMVLHGMSISGADIYVPASRLEEAKALLEDGGEDLPEEGGE